ncbi:Nicotinamidase-related amidase [bacterium A37T11]|nr:Nicotinamidase-related amidase [bacterium A37T11]
MSSALIIIDIQLDYFKNGAMELVGAEEAAANAKLILASFRSQNLPVIHIQHISTRPEATFFLPDTTGVRIHPDVTPLPDERVIVKHYPNSFRETGLLAYLQTLPIQDLVIIGMMTHNCIDSTTRAAKDFGYDCTIIADACATKDLQLNSKLVPAEFVQNAFLAGLSYYYANIVTTEAFLK